MAILGVNWQGPVGDEPQLLSVNEGMTPGVESMGSPVCDFETCSCEEKFASIWLSGRLLLPALGDMSADLFVAQDCVEDVSESFRCFLVTVAVSEVGRF